MKHVRFLLSLVPAFLLLSLLFGVIAFSASRLPGGLGVAIGLIAGASIVLGLLLFYYNGVDWLNLRVIRRTMAEGAHALEDGAVVAFTGTVRTEGESLTSPFSELRCAAYTYVVSGSRHSNRNSGSTRVVCAEGLHMVPTVIEGTSASLRVRALPGFEDDLRKNTRGGDWGTAATKLLERLWQHAPSGAEHERRGTLLEARHEVLESIRQDYCQTKAPSTGDGLTVDEEVLPVDVAVTMVGTYDAELRALTARRARFGENLMVYRGTAEDVLARVGGEIAWYAKATGILLATGALLLSLAFLPPRWAAMLPFVDLAVDETSDRSP